MKQNIIILGGGVERNIAVSYYSRILYKNDVIWGSNHISSNFSILMELGATQENKERKMSIVCVLSLSPQIA